MTYNVPIRRLLGGNVLQVDANGTAVANGVIQIDNGGVLLGQESPVEIPADFPLSLLSPTLGAYDATVLGEWLSIVGAMVNAEIAALQQIGAIP